MRVYCHDNDLRPIQDAIKERIKSFKRYSEHISYRGKNLNRVKEVLEGEKTKLGEGSMLDYQINFGRRTVLVTADLATFEAVKNEILKLVNAGKGECDICADVMRNPYRFLNCGCSFCWLCIADHIRCFRNSPDEEVLTCPGH